METDFSYLSYLILYVLLIYFLILSIFLVIRRYEIKARSRDRPPVFHQSIYDDSSFTFNWTTKVEEVADSFYGRNYRIFLAFIRVLGALYFFVYGIIIAGSQDSRTFNYFDGWNTIVAFLYFFASSCLTIGLIKFSTVPGNENESRTINSSPSWSYYIRLSAVTAHLLFEICGANAIFILFGEIVKISSIGTLHVTNIVVLAFLLLDIFFNNLKVRFDQYPATAAFLMCYFLVIWPSVFTGAMSSWPYRVLRTDSSICFGNYTAFFVANFSTYVLWYCTYKIKRRLALYFMYGRNGLHRDEEGLHMIELMDLHSQSRTSSQQDEDEAATSFYTLPEGQGQADNLEDRDQDLYEIDPESAADYGERRLPRSSLPRNPTARFGNGDEDLMAFADL